MDTTPLSFREPSLLTQAEAAKRLGVHVNTLGQWRKRGSGPKWYRIGPKLIRYDESDVERWIQEMKDRVGS